MIGKLVQPVLFNVITIVAMLFSLFQVVSGSSERITRTGEAIQLLEQLADEGVLEDDTIVSGLVADQEMWLGLSTYLIVTMIIAILANVIANYLGRGRQHANTVRNSRAGGGTARSARGLAHPASSDSPRYAVLAALRYSFWHKWDGRWRNWSRQSRIRLAVAHEHRWKRQRFQQGFCCEPLEIRLGPGKDPCS